MKFWSSPCRWWGCSLVRRRCYTTKSRRHSPSNGAEITPPSSPPSASVRTTNILLDQRRRGLALAHCLYTLRNLRESPKSLHQHYVFFFKAFLSSNIHGWNEILIRCMLAEPIPISMDTWLKIAKLSAYKSPWKFSDVSPETRLRRIFTEPQERNDQSFTNLLEAMVENGTDAEEVGWTLERYLKIYGETNVHPSVYIAAIRAFSTRGDFGRSLASLDRLRTHPMYPDSYFDVEDTPRSHPSPSTNIFLLDDSPASSSSTPQLTTAPPHSEPHSRHTPFKTILRNIQPNRHLQLKSVTGVLDRMKEDSVPCDTEIVSMLMQLYIAGKFYDHAAALYQDVLSGRDTPHGLPPPSSQFFRAVFDSLSRIRNLDILPPRLRPRQVVRDMLTIQQHPSSSFIQEQSDIHLYATFEVAITCLLRFNDYPATLTLLSLFPPNQITPSEQKRTRQLIANILLTRIRTGTKNPDDRFVDAFLGMAFGRHRTLQYVNERFWLRLGEVRKRVEYPGRMEWDIWDLVRKGKMGMEESEKRGEEEELLYSMAVCERAVRADVMAKDDVQDESRIEGRVRQEVQDAWREITGREGDAPKRTEKTGKAKRVYPRR